jgi:hypothetical protein
MEHDARGIPLVNTVGRPFDPPIETDDHYQVITKEVNSTSFDTAHFNNYINAINSDNFLGFLPHQVKCANISAQDRWKGPYRFVNARFEFHVKTKDLVQAWDLKTQTTVQAKGWDKVVLNQGFYHIENPFDVGNGAAPEVGRILNRHIGGSTTNANRNDPIDEPALLNESGVVITAGQLLDGLADKAGGIKPVWVRFQQYQALPFSGTGAST